MTKLTEVQLKVRQEDEEIRDIIGDNPEIWADEYGELYWRTENPLEDVEGNKLYQIVFNPLYVNITGLM